METHDIERPLQELSPEELIESIESGELSIEDLLEDDDLRKRIRKFVVKQDMEEHREIYDRLAEV